MKIFFFLLSLGMFFLAGCSQQQGVSQDNFFDKKKECSNMQEKVMTYIAKSKDLTLNTIFYSPEKDSCLYLLDGYTSYNDMSWQVVEDIFTNEVLLTTWCNDLNNDNIECIPNSEKFQKRLRELKGE